MSLISPWPQDQADLALQNAGMISAHVDALAEEVELALGIMHADITEKINVIER